MLVSYWKDLPPEQFLKLRASGIRWYLSTIVLWSIRGLFVRLLNNSIHIIIFITFRQLIFAVLSAILLVLSVRTTSLEQPEFNRGLLYYTSGFMVLVLLAQIVFVYAIGEARTITDVITSFQGVITLIVSLVIARLVSNTTLNEPLDQQSIVIRIIGAILSTLGTLGVILNSI